MTGSGELSWNAVRLAGDNSVGGKLFVEAERLIFRPGGKGQASDVELWSFDSDLAEIAEVAVADRTLEQVQFSLERGIRVRTFGGSQATFYLSGRAKNRTSLVVPDLQELVRSSRPGEVGTPRPASFVDSADRAPTPGSMKFVLGFQRHFWWIGLLTIVTFTPELISGIQETSGLAKAWVLVFPGIFMAIGIDAVVRRFAKITSRSHPLLAVLPLSFYLVGVSILALVIFAFYEMPISAALAPLIFGIPSAIVAAITLSPRRRRAWREARDNDARRHRPDARPAAGRSLDD